MGWRHTRIADDDLLVCAAVLGAFGVTAQEVRRYASTDGRRGPDEESLESTLEASLEDAGDRTTFLECAIAQSDRGIDCSARYGIGTLERELTGVFEALGWSVSTRPVADGLVFHATDPAGRSRETAITYPDTPLETDNLPAVLAAITGEILSGTDATFVLLSSGADRWRAALVETSVLERLRAAHGERVAVFDRPLLPEHGLEAYVPASESESAGSEGGNGVDGRGGERESTRAPWPDWALERACRREREGEDGQSTSGRSKTGGSESVVGSTASGGSEPSAVGRTNHIDGSNGVGETSTAGGANDVSAMGSADDHDATNSRERDGYTLVGGSPTVTRSSTRSGERTESADDRSPARTDTPASGGDTTAEKSQRLEKILRTNATSDSRAAGTTESSSATDARKTASASDATGTATSDDARADRTTGTDRPESDRTECNDRASVVSRRAKRETETAGFGTLSGSSKTTRVSNNSFGTGVTQTEDERFRALGAAMNTGANVSVSGLLDDDEFLPELPAVEPQETRVSYEEEFDPTALPKAKAAAEESGFVWVQSGPIETTRVSNE